MESLGLSLLISALVGISAVCWWVSSLRELPCWMRGLHGIWALLTLTMAVVTLTAIFL